MTGRLLLALAAFSIVTGVLQSAAADDGENLDACGKSYVQAQELRLDNHLLEARAELLVCARSDCADFYQKECAVWLSEVERDLPSVVVDVRDANGVQLSTAKIQIDGRVAASSVDGKAVQLNPGPHRASALLDASQAKTVSFVVLAGEKNRRLSIVIGSKKVTDPAAPARSTIQRIHPVFWVFGGLTVLSAGVLTFAGVSALQTEDTLKEECGQIRKCTQDDLDRLYTYRTIADVSLGGVGAFSIAAVVALAVSLTAPADSVVSYGPGGVSIAF
jgi:hypothetical protein